MGMDVYGRRPTGPVGEYFRANARRWHPLWDLCEAVAPDLTATVQHGRSNDGDGLGADDAMRLAKALRAGIATGEAASYVIERNARLAALPLEACLACGGTGSRRPPPEIGSGDVKCKRCEGTGNVAAWETNYTLTLDDIVEFAEFVAASGGFEIW